MNERRVYAKDAILPPEAPKTVRRVAVAAVARKENDSLTPFLVNQTRISLSLGHTANATATKIPPITTTLRSGTTIFPTPPVVAAACAATVSVIRIVVISVVVTVFVFHFTLTDSELDVLVAEPPSPFQMRLPKPELSVPVGEALIAKVLLPTTM
jgi:hypothetical protein